MASTLKYIVDEKGHKTSVLVPLSTWEDMNDRYDRLFKKLQVLMGIQNGLEEIKKSKKSGKKLQTLKDFLNESKG